MADLVARTPYPEPPLVKPVAGGTSTRRTEYEAYLLSPITQKLERFRSFSDGGQAYTARLRQLDFLLKHGRFFTPKALPKVYRAEKRGSCYLNAQSLGMDLADLTYVEGRGLDIVGFDYDHGWCVDSEGGVIDPTWTGRRGRTLCKAYFGVPLAESYFVKVIATTGWHDKIINDDTYFDPTVPGL
jgi:hypothetical protein